MFAIYVMGVFVVPCIREKGVSADVKSDGLHSSPAGHPCYDDCLVRPLPIRVAWASWL